MSKRKREILFYSISGVLSLAGMVQALADPMDKPSHLRAYLFGALLLTVMTLLALKIRGKI
jgi:hypothetical protein